MKNQITDLNDHLFMALERLNLEDLSTENIDAEATRAKAIVLVADKVLDTRRVTLAAAKFVFEATGALPEGSSARLIGHSNGDG